MEDNSSTAVKDPLATYTMDQGDCSVVNFQNQITTIKLDNTNFLVWEQQIIEILCSSDLENFLMMIHHQCS